MHQEFLSLFSQNIVSDVPLNTIKSRATFPALYESRCVCLKRVRRNRAGIRGNEALPCCWLGHKIKDGSKWRREWRSLWSDCRYA